MKPVYISVSTPQSLSLWRSKVRGRRRRTTVTVTSILFSFLSSALFQTFGCELQKEINTVWCSHLRIIEHIVAACMTRRVVCHATRIGTHWTVRQVTTVTVCVAVIYYLEAEIENRGRLVFHYCKAVILSLSRHGGWIHHFLSTSVPLVYKWDHLLKLHSNLLKMLTIH
jgi:hypothetical protein